MRSKVTPVSKARWKSICTDCAGAIDSLVELLQGRFSKGVMETDLPAERGPVPVAQRNPLSCSCPDWAGMCKHVAAVLYGIGARFDQQPELLFRLHAVNEEELIAKAGRGLSLAKQGPAASKLLGGEDLSGIFGVEMAQGIDADADAADAKAKTRKPRAPKAAKPATPKKGKPRSAKRQKPASKKAGPRRSP